VEVTVRQAIENAAALLSAVVSNRDCNTVQHSIDVAKRSVRLDAEVLLMHLLGCSLTALLTHPERLLSPDESARYDALLRRRLAAEPIQYITGEQEFFGLTMKVTPDVLIPRPETEHLVEAVLHRVSRAQTIRILDVGTGSGAIAVALAHALPKAGVTGVDLSLAALEVARGNAIRHGVSERVQLLQSDLLAEVRGELFDAVVSNPPYIAESEDLEPQVRDYEPHRALFAGPSGLEIYRRLIPEAHLALKPGGYLLLEIGYQQRAALSELLNHWENVSFIDDLQGIPRVAIANRPNTISLQR
jgi:release factor glutamine methyltransferase